MLAQSNKIIIFEIYNLNFFTVVTIVTIDIIDHFKHNESRLKLSRGALYDSINQRIWFTL